MYSKCLSSSGYHGRKNSFKAAENVLTVEKDLYPSKAFFPIKKGILRPYGMIVGLDNLKKATLNLRL